MIKTCAGVVSGLLASEFETRVPFYVLGYVRAESRRALAARILEAREEKAREEKEGPRREGPRREGRAL